MMLFIFNIINSLRFGDVWHKYKKRVIDQKPCVDYKQGPGYYLNTFIMSNPIKENQRTAKKMRSGKIGLFRLVEYRHCYDPDDMIEWATWQFLGYVGEKLIEDMTFSEWRVFARDCVKSKSGLDRSK